MQNLDHYRVLLQLSLGQDVTSLRNIMIDDWPEIFEFAQRQGIVGFLFEGVKRLHDEFGYDVSQPNIVSMNFYSRDNKIEKPYSDTKDH